MLCAARIISPRWIRDALVRQKAGAVFHKGKLLERPVNITPAEPGEPSETEVA